MTPYTLTLPYGTRVVVFFEDSALDYLYLSELSEHSLGHAVFSYCLGVLMRSSDEERAALPRFYLNTEAEWRRLRLAVYDSLYLSMGL